MKVHFYLDRRKGKAERLPIFMHFWYKRKLLRIFTGEHCDPLNWDSKSERIIDERPDAVLINRLLQSMEDEVLTIVRQARIGRRDIDTDLIRANLTFIKGAERDLFSVYDEFIIKGSMEKKWGAGMVRRFNILRMHLKIINKQHRVSFYNIDDHFYNRFIEYHYQQGFQKSYAARNLELFRLFMNWATFQGYNLNMAYKNFVSPKSEPVSFNQNYLTADELIRLYELKTDDTILMSVKDMFCFGCLTGLRYADLVRLGEENIKDGRLIYKREKPEMNLEIPLVNRAIEILNRYNPGTNGRIFPDHSIQRFNYSLKLLGKFAGLDTPVYKKNDRDDGKQKQTCPKWKLLSSKFARLTFLRLGVEKGIGLEMMSEMTGNLPGTIKKYYHVEREKKIREMQKLNILSE